MSSAPRYQHYFVYTRAAGWVGSKYTGFGSLWMPWERRGDFSRIINTLRETHGYEGGLGLSSVRPESVPFMLALVDELFRRRWLSFRALITPVTEGAPPSRSWAHELLARRIGDLGEANFRVRVDGGHEALAEQLALRLADPAELEVRKARGQTALEVIDLLLGLVMTDWDRKNANTAKRAVGNRIAENLGWKDLAADTPSHAWKFNLWFAEDPGADGAADKTARSVQLRLPLID